MGRPPGRPPGRGRGPGRPRGGGRPAGRPRRMSNSTVASTDLSHARYVPETAVLKEQKIVDIADWPTFVLKNAVVYRKTRDGQLEVANICNVDLEGPFIIRGRLDIDMEEDRPYLLNLSRNTSSFIEISASVTYSVGYGPWPAVWAAGKGGWYEINPAPEYEAMYEVVCEGITLYYVLMLAYLAAQEEAAAKEPAARGKRAKALQAKALQMPIERLLLKYAVAIGDGVTHSEAKNRCQKHASFLLAHFSKEPDINWNATSFKKWMSSENKELVKRLIDAANKIRVPPEPSEKQPSPQSSIVDAKIEPQDGPDVLLPFRISSTESDRARRSRSRANRSSPELNVEMQDAQPALPPKRIETPILPPLPGQVPSIPGIRPHAPPASLTDTASAATVTTDVVDDKAEDSSSHIQDPIGFLKDLLEEILIEAQGDPSKVKEGTVHSKMYLKCSTQYQACREVTHFYAKQLVASIPSKWYGSPFFHYLKDIRNKPWEPGLLTAETVPLQLARRKKKTLITKNRGAFASPTPRPGQGAGKHFPGTPRPSPALRPGQGAKRPIFYGDDEEDGRPRKHVRTASDFDSEEDEDDSDEDDSDEDESDDNDIAADVAQNGALDTPVRGAGNETVRLVIRADKIPTMSPSGPNGTWRCEEEGCNYIVRSAEEAEGKELIDRHFEEHADRVRKMTLALAEGTRGHLPINHLLDKIRSLGEDRQQRSQTNSDGGDLPKPIKRRLLI